MHQQALDIIDDLEENPPPLPAEEITEGQALLRWLADTHFTFLGYREYQLEDVGDGSEDVALRAVPGTGFGILRSDQDMSASFAKLPPLVRAKAREKTLLVLAKANSKATVHRPVYLDYVGVKTFDENGEVVGERRFLGLFSSAAYTESLTRIPVIRVKAKQVIDRAGFAPLSHSGKALMDVLETYPRDELFQTPIDELSPIAESVLHTRERRQVRLFVRRDTYGRYLSCLVYLPAGPVQHRGARAHRRHPQDPARRRVAGVHRPCERVAAGPPALRDPAEGRRDDRRLRPGRPRAPARGSGAVVARRLRLRGARGVRRGGGRPAGPASTPSRSPRRTRRTTRPAPAPSTSAASRASRPRAGSTCPSTSCRRPARSEARLKIFRTGDAAVAVRGAADPVLDGGRGRRRAALRARRARARRRTSTTSGCATTGRCPPAAASSSRTRSTPCGRATTRSTASTPSCSPSG